MQDASNGKSPSIVSPGYLALALCLGLSGFLVVFYLYLIQSFVRLPADILMYSDSSFVGDIIKLRTGIPIYTPPQDNNSLVYTPAAPIVTYAIAWLIGMPTSIVAWRLIQLGFVLCAAVVAAAAGGWPSASPSGNQRRERVSLTIATDGPSGPSAFVKSRPRTTGTRSAAKYPGVMTRQSISGPSPGGYGGAPITEKPDV